MPDPIPTDPRHKKEVPLDPPVFPPIPDPEDPEENDEYENPATEEEG